MSAPRPLPPVAAGPTCDRRSFLERMAALAGLATLPPSWLACATTSPPLGRQAPVFEDTERAVVAAACARLIPTDDLPGASEANVVGFIEGQIGLPMFEIFRREFAAGVTALDHLATAARGLRFVQLDAAVQDQVLTALQDGDGSSSQFSAAHFFQVLFTLCLEGFLSHPRHGGNRNLAGWKVLGFAPDDPRPRGARAS